MESVYAVIEEAEISITCKMNDGAVAALELPTFANVYLPDAVPFQNTCYDSWLMQGTKAKILMYPIHYLEQDGFIATAMLMKIKQETGKLWGFFGPPKDWGDQRCHLIYDAKFAAPPHNFQVLDWEIKSWTKKTQQKT